MTDELQQVSSQQEILSAPQVSIPSPVQPQKSKKNIWIIVGIVLVFLCLCSIACVALFGTSLFKVYTEKAPVASVLDAFMKNMEAKDVKSAYALFSPRAQRQTPISDVEKMDQGNNYVLFEGYEGTTIQNLNLTAAVNTNQNMPQGTIATVTATISYKDGFTGKLTAVLEKVDDEWKLFNINVTVPPDKLQP